LPPGLKEERPRERLLSRGAEALTDAELVAILLRIGVRGASAVDMARPSESDRLLTKDLIAATRPLAIKVLDHLVVAGEDFYSFADNGLLDELEWECLAPGTVAPAPKLARAEQT